MLPGSDPITKRRDKAVAFIIGLLIVVFALYLRLTGITWGIRDLNLPHQSFHPDEVGNLNSIVNTNPKLYTDYDRCWYYNKGILMHTIWSATLYLLGLKKDVYSIDGNILSSMYLAMRLVVVLASLANLLLVYLIARILYPGIYAALMAAFLLAIIPAEVINAHYAKTDIPAETLLLLSFFFISRFFLKEAKNKELILACLFAGLAISTKYSSIVILFPIAYAAIVKSDAARDLKRFVKLALGGMVFVLLGFSIGCPDIFLHTNEFIDGLKEQYIVQHSAPGDTIGRTTRYTDFIVRVLPYSMSISGFFLACIGVFLSFFLLNKKPVWLIFCLVIPYLLWSMTSWPLVRYSTLLMPFLGMLIGMGVVEIVSNFRFLPWMQIYLSVFIAVLCLLTMSVSIRYVNAMAGEDPRELAKEWIEENVSPASRIGLVHPGLYPNPRLDERRYALVSMYEDIDYLDTDALDLVVLSSLTYNQVLRVDSLDPRASKFYGFLLDDSSFDKLVAFDNYPKGKLFKGLLPPKDPPIDWLYPFPIILVLEPKISYCGRLAGGQPPRQNQYIIIR